MPTLAKIIRWKILTTVINVRKVDRTGINTFWSLFSPSCGCRFTLILSHIDHMSDWLFILSWHIILWQNVPKQADFDPLHLVNIDTNASLININPRRFNRCYTLKLSPQPQVPLMLGLLNTNSLWSLSVTKSISDPNKVICALLSINTFTPGNNVLLL